MNLFFKIAFFGYLTVQMGMLVSCKHQPILDLVPGPDDTTTNPVDTGTTNPGRICDPDSVYFNVQILPILVSNCAMSGCHDAATHEEGIILNNYDNVIRTGKIKPFDLNEDFFETITETKDDKRMPPPPRPKLSSDQINLIRTWILQGAKNLECDPDGNNCDPSTATFAAVVKPILDNYCVGCHRDGLENGGINLSVYSKVKAAASGGKLYGSINHSPGFIAMPQGGNKLNDCFIQKIKFWIDAGAPDN